jgi:hypothetical protein
MTDACDLTYAGGNITVFSTDTASSSYDTSEEDNYPKDTPVSFDEENETTSSAIENTEVNTTEETSDSNTEITEVQSEENTEVQPVENTDNDSENIFPEESEIPLVYEQTEPA